MGRFVLLFTGFSVAVAAGLGWAVYDFVRAEIPDLALLRDHFPVVHYHGSHAPPEIKLEKKKPDGWVSIGMISKQAADAVVVSEDWAFYQHHGYDPNQIREAIHQDWEEGTFARGASTITQQVVKNVFLEKDKNLWRKLKELFLATRLEAILGKRKILEVYLNIAEWGDGIFGIHAAAEKYFHKSPLELTAKEGAFLAMLLPSPRRYGQSFRKHRLTDYASKTVDAILTKMVQAHFLTEDERLLETSRTLSFEEPLESASPLPNGSAESEPDELTL